MNMSTDPAALASRGVRRNGKRSFTLELSGSEVYFLLKRLEEDAVSSANYLEVRQAVAFAERIREQVNRQGF